MGRSRQDNVLSLTVAQTARMLVNAMEQIHAGIGDVASASGRLEAELANDTHAETLSTPRAERTFALVAALSRAYDELAEHLQGLAE